MTDSLPENPAIDIEAQHAHICTLVDALTQARDGSGGDTADLVLQHIIRFMTWHFVSEERSMEKVAYPHLDEHRAEHADCLNTLRGIAGEMDATCRIDLDRASRYLSTWLRDHHNLSDSRFLEWLRATRAA